MTYSADDHRSAIKATLDALPPPLHVKAICKACPHPAECRGKLCLNDIARLSRHHGNPVRHRLRRVIDVFDREI
jgi:hypothetical protein